MTSNSGKKIIYIINIILISLIVFIIINGIFLINQRSTIRDEYLSLSESLNNKANQVSRMNARVAHFLTFDLEERSFEKLKNNANDAAFQYYGFNAVPYELDRDLMRHILSDDPLFIDERLDEDLENYQKYIETMNVIFDKAIAAEDRNSLIDAFLELQPVARKFLSVAEDLVTTLYQYNMTHTSFLKEQIDNSIKIYIITTILITVSIILVIIFFLIFHKVNQKNKLMLIDLNNKLEENVAEKTSKLRTSLEQLQGAQEQIIRSEKRASLIQLVSGIAHEINTPLGTSITCVSYIDKCHKQLVNQMNTSKLTHSYLSDYNSNLTESLVLIQSSLLKMTELIDTIKEINGGEYNSYKTTFKLIECINLVISSMQNDLNEASVTSEIACPDSIRLTANLSTLTQIIHHLVTNSLNHGFEDLSTGIIKIEAFQDVDCVEIHYSDNGVGIPSDDQRKIFDPFYTTKRGEGHTGLGLHTISNLVHFMNGSLALTNTETKGTHFIISLPNSKEI